MPELASDFQSLSPEYQHILRLAQEQHNIAITPLQQLAGGRSGALIYLVSVSSQNGAHIEHLILKLDRKNIKAKSDETVRHHTVLEKSPQDFARNHIAAMAFARIEHDGAIGVFYSVAGQSLRDYQPLSSYGQQHRLEAIFAATHKYFLEEWNVDRTFKQALHPQQLLHTWLGFRLDAGGYIERFMQETGRVRPDTSGLLINGNVFPNPLLYSRKPEPWGAARAIDAVFGFHHGDLNVNNILVKFSGNDIAGYYLIDFALFKEHMPLLYDLRYLEMSYLALNLSDDTFAKWVELVIHYANVDTLDPPYAPIEMAGVCAVINAARSAFDRWVKANHPSLHDDLWGQYWLAGVAAGLSYCHKAGQPDQERLAGLIYAAANLKRYVTLFSLPRPVEVATLFDESHSTDTSIAGSPRHSPPHNLPAQPTTFIGRDAEVAAIRDLLMHRDNRLVTLTGPGGAGKTRVSLRVANDLLDRFNDGVFFVSLADTSDPDLVVSRIAQQLDVREGGSQPLQENLKSYLRGKTMLLVLDNFEQLIDAAPMVADLLAATKELKILVSSRIPLNVQAEHEFLVPPLRLPEHTESALPQDISGYEAVRLFVERARAAQPGFALNDENAQAVAEICRRLDGLPLAIELAAARIKLLTPQAMLARLRDALKLLTSGARDRPQRHRTLRSTLEWSYHLLAEEHKILFARLGVFVGGFTLEAAEAICNSDGALDVLEGVSALVNNSLLIQENARFGMLQTIREYALERLQESGEWIALQQQHALYYADVIIHEAGLALYSADATYWLEWIEREYGNVQATLTWTQSAPKVSEAGPVFSTWAQSTPEGGKLGPALSSSLVWFWYRRGYFNEGRMWSDRILDSPEAQGATINRTLALTASAQMAMWQSDLKIAFARAQEGLAIARTQEDTSMVAFTLLSNGIVLVNMGRDSAAHPLLIQAQALFKEIDFTYFYAVSLVHLGNVALGLGHVDEARESLDKALHIARELREAWLLSFALNNLGEVARRQGDYHQARGYYEESEALLRSNGDVGDLARLIHNLGYIAQHEGDDQRAEEKFRESLAMFRRLGNKRGIAECLAGLAGLQAQAGQPQPAAQLLSAADALLNATGAAWWPADRGEIERNRATIQSALDEHTFASAWAAGQAMTLEQAVTFVTHDR
jgi:predicted ATPase